MEQAIERGGVVARGDRLLVACSGGPDSVALVAALAAVSKPMELAISLAHVNHGVRTSAWQDECVVARIAATFGVALETIALKPGGSAESELRDARYAALEAAAGRAGATAIATAHHAEDQSETVLLALFRGAGPEGIAGMRARRAFVPGLELCRPLLRIDSHTLRDYCHAYALPYCIDPTNADTELRRNAVREALSALRPLFPGLDAAVARAAELSGDELDASDRAALRRRVRDRLGEETALRDVDFAHVEAAVRALERGGSGSFHMKAGLALEIESGAIAGITKR
ncbi:MAG: tRNA lysidine(34) synthetase TilS [Candidatus Eremiobacteraeota bacterium]|nr:tRNA lysidine(34) synthetase TilS [Candidatus Eremiobacteraeota bacterium]